MGVIRNLPTLDRPREKALRYGLSSLSDIELLAIILGSGYRDNSVMEISTQLISKYGGLNGLCSLPLVELKKNKGVKNVRALNIATIFEINRRIETKNIENSEEPIDEIYLYNKYKNIITGLKQESIFIIILNRNKHIIFEKNLSTGSEDSVLVSFHSIYRELLLHDGKYYYLIHNHTNGDHNPSKLDIKATKRLFIESDTMGIPLLDHIIISEKGYYSFTKMKKTKISC